MVVDVLGVKCVSSFFCSGIVSKTKTIKVLSKRGGDFKNSRRFPQGVQGTGTVTARRKGDLQSHVEGKVIKFIFLQSFKNRFCICFLNASTLEAIGV